VTASSISIKESGRILHSQNTGETIFKNSQTYNKNNIPQPYNYQSNPETVFELDLQKTS
jgi:hypothetical protein